MNIDRLLDIIGHIRESKSVNEYELKYMQMRGYVQSLLTAYEKDKETEKWAVERLRFAINFDDSEDALDR